MDADLDTLCTVVYCTADDLLPEARRNVRRKVTDAELVTLCVAQAIMGIPSDRRFLAVAARRLIHLFLLARAHRRGKKVALVAVARELLELSWTLLLRGEVYRAAA